METPGGHRVDRSSFKNVSEWERYVCLQCHLLLRDAVQTICGHRLCQVCVDSLFGRNRFPVCPDCGEELIEEDGAKCFPDRFVRREIQNFSVYCTNHSHGCDWEGIFKELDKHVSTVCKFKCEECKCCGKSVSTYEVDKHRDVCQCTLLDHSHVSQVYSSVHSYHGLNTPQPVPFLTPFSGFSFNSGSSVPTSNNMGMASQRLLSLRDDFVQKLNSVVEEMRQEEAKTKQYEEDICNLHLSVSKLEKMVQAKNAEIEDRDYRLSLIENSNYDGTMVWKIPQFSQRMDDARSGKYTSIFSLPFYTNRYGYKICLRLYILGDGIGKGSHMSLFFVIMHGEFDNILQWPFTHKVTFRLINQTGARDITDTFQPDPMSSSFKKPKSDMNIASGCPRFVSLDDLQSGGFIVDETVFIKCAVDKTAIRNP